MIRMVVYPRSNEKIRLNNIGSRRRVAAGCRLLAAGGKIAVIGGESIDFNISKNPHG